MTYTLSKADRDLYGRTVPFDFDRRHAISAAVQVRVASHVRVSASTQFATGFPATPVTEEVEFVNFRRPDGSADPLFRTRRHTDGSLITNRGYPFRLSLQNSERLRAYARTDVRVTYAWGPHWEFYGEVINLFNRTTNFTTRESSGIGFVGFYQSHPLLPTYGVRVNF